MKNKPCVVVGGGTVALRKVEMLVEHQARVTVISPEICAGIVAMSQSTISIKKRKYEFGDIDGAFVVVAATDDEMINEKIAQEAMRKGILINVVDMPALCSFIVPSYLKRGDLTIAVSTNGKSPALARRIRTRLEQDFSPDYAQLIALIETVRAELKEKDLNASPEKWQQALDIENLMELIRLGEFEGARQALMKTLTGVES